MDIAITGSTGLIGEALRTRLLADGHRVVRVVRHAPEGPDEIRWDPGAGRLAASDLDGLDAVVHLAGEGIAEKRWTPAQKDRILTSRTAGTTLLAERLAEAGDGPRVLISGSAIGWYGDRGDEVLTEASPIGDGFLADVCRQWEAAADPARAAGVRVAHIRTGIVLDPHGGVLAKQLPLFKVGLGGRIGSGRQYMSWIAIEDEVGAICHLLDHEVEGPVNLTAPDPVTNRAFTEALGAALHRPTVVPVPGFGPKLLFGGELVDELLLASQRVLPERLTESGYAFSQPELGPALETLLAPTPAGG
ncbi:MAG: TIGR01777 family oxidoreductase [Acidimicrobiales bacterium]|nr:TIGR01777 family oxidoreductase [Acidimicrobiales bacterium]